MPDTPDKPRPAPLTLSAEALERALSLLRDPAAATAATKDQGADAADTGPPLSPALCNAADLGAMVRRLRRRQGLSQGDVAARTGLRTATLSAIENGAGGTRLETLFTLLQTLGYDLTLRRIETP